MTELFCIFIGQKSGQVREICCFSGHLLSSLINNTQVLLALVQSLQREERSGLYN